MVRIRLPRRPIILVRLIAPHRPILPRAPSEQFEERTGTARLDDIVLLVRLAGMFSLARRQKVDLSSSGRERAGVLAAHAEQDQLRDIAKIKTDASPIRAAVLADLVPDNVGFVSEAPRFHHFQAVRQQRVGAPQVKMGSLRSDQRYRQRLYFFERESAVARQTSVFGRYFSGLVRELPRRVCENGRKPALSGKSEKV